MKIKTNDKLSILILIRADTVERIENLISVVRFISKNMPSKVSVFECSTYYNGILQGLLKRKIDYTFIEDPDPILHRTHYINQMAIRAITPYISVWDLISLLIPIRYFRH